MTPAVNVQRLWHELETLAAWTDAPSPAVTRVVFSDTDLRARRYFKACCDSAGLAVHEDPVGNKIGRAHV